jgi:hypothetical protein
LQSWCDHTSPSALAADVPDQSQRPRCDDRDDEDVKEREWDEIRAGRDESLEVGIETE